MKMNYKLVDAERVPGNGVAHRSSDLGISSAFIPRSWRDTAKRNFILQLGFDEPDPADRPRLYSALVFQPKVVFITIVAGIVFQSSVIFMVLGAALWISSLFPKLNPFTALYNRIFSGRPGAIHLGPAPTPRRAAEAEAGMIALTIQCWLTLDWAVRPIYSRPSSGDSLAGSPHRQLLHGIVYVSPGSWAMELHPTDPSMGESGAGLPKNVLNEQANEVTQEDIRKTKAISNLHGQTYVRYRRDILMLVPRLLSTQPPGTTRIATD